MVRVFLHDLLWEQDPEGLLDRIDAFLDLADGHGIATMLVLFDHVWGPEPHLGPQPEPVPGVHNSGWVQAPARADTLAFSGDPALRARLEGYVTGVVSAFRSDRRVVVWDVLNEPGNSLIFTRSLPLLEAAFDWVRAVEPHQPVTAGAWFLHARGEVSRRAIERSDVVTFHDYQPVDRTADVLDRVRELGGGRPVLCTEYMARTEGSRFETHLPLFSRRGRGGHPLGPGVGSVADDLALGLAARPRRDGTRGVVPRRAPPRRGAPTTRPRRSTSAPS